MPTTRTGIHAALLAAQREFPDIKKTATADTGKFKYSYAMLPDVIESLVPILHKHEIVMLQPTVSTETEVTLQTILHHVPSGEEVASSVLMPLPNDPQAWGSAMTYLRRYSLLSVCGVAPEDDDDGARAQQTYRAPARPAARPSGGSSEQYETCPEHGLAWRPTSRGNNAHPIKDGSGKLLGWCDEEQFKARGAVGDAEEMDRQAQTHQGEF